MWRIPELTESKLHFKFTDLYRSISPVDVITPTHKPRGTVEVFCYRCLSDKKKNDPLLPVHPSIHPHMQQMTYTRLWSFIYYIIINLILNLYFPFSEEWRGDTVTTLPRYTFWVVSCGGLCTMELLNVDPLRGAVPPSRTDAGLDTYGTLQG